MSPHESKICATCGRRFEWQKRWAKNWDEVRYCSARCRSSKPNRVDTQLEAKIIELCESRGPSKSICPSEAARAIFEDWEPEMERTRRAARRLAHAGKIEIQQRGKRVDPSEFRGAVRLVVRRG